MLERGVGGRGPTAPPPVFYWSLNPTTTGGGQIILNHYYCPPPPNFFTFRHYCIVSSSTLKLVVHTITTLHTRYMTKISSSRIWLRPKSSLQIPFTDYTIFLLERCSGIQFDVFQPLIQVILFEIDCAIFYTNLHELFCQFISWTNWVNSGKFMVNCWYLVKLWLIWKNFKTFS